MRPVRRRSALRVLCHLPNPLCVISEGAGLVKGSLAAGKSDLVERGFGAAALVYGIGFGLVVPHQVWLAGGLASFPGVPGQRRHSSIGMLSPIEYERRHAETTARDQAC